MSNTRVRKPPGGDSSFNIFGIANEPIDAKKAKENNQKATDDNTQKATDSDTKKATDSDTKKATGNEEPHVTTDAVAKDEEACQKAEDKSIDDKEKKDAEAEEEEEKKKKEQLKDAVDQNSVNATPTSVIVQDSPAKSENQNTPDSSKSKPKAAYNPITGEQYGSPDPEKKTVEKTVEPAKSVGPTRVRQPPGGASSKLW